MNIHKYITAILTGAVCMAVNACSNFKADKQPHEISSTSVAVAGQKTKPVLTDSLNTQKRQLTAIYSRAISEFIKAAYKRDKTIFDTLYFGKHVYGQPDDFPDIELPEEIENTRIILVPVQAGQKMQQERKRLVYINMMGWVEKEKAAFVLVVFSNGMEHQYDYTISFNYNNSKKEFELSKIEFEDYLHSNGSKPERITVYTKGKYIKVAQ